MLMRILTSSCAEHEEDSTEVENIEVSTKHLDKKRNLITPKKSIFEISRQNFNEAPSIKLLK